MFIQKVKIKIKSNADKDEVVNELDMLMQFYRGSGQTQGRIESQFIKKDTVVAFPFTHEKKALDAKWNNFYVKKRIKIIEKLCQSKIEIKTVGKTYATYKSACTCKKRPFLILMTNYTTIQSPIKCGKCGCSVPLYRLPIFYDHGYMPILSWESNYAACDMLQMNCEVGENWAIQQMQDVSSELSKQGIEICKKIEELAQIPTFYYLYNYREPNNEAEKQCPSCGSDWALKKRLHDMYDCKCDKCRLISPKTYNSG